uniref:Uncharacterized protein n=1 Tax=Chromera velia CCMP2878 TaxID=1169474 RepID=A0A0G4HKT0_9ALVE|eukprot:Cvel_28531.t1-p1 / transcript=Cvel_28531.t1 / gene=Cvel_28531 / organism=Chromera_velia_CCMP2878 / gene_product=hypothetical protein / transcript_product=hypothetical protein / location=Cvel_scaffold3755:12218-12478(-) / protein_length=87 / sequence_SO=supercontig / SO=protein_coding / is_pseudo=false
MRKRKGRRRRSRKARRRGEGEEEAEKEEKEPTPQISCFSCSSFVPTSHLSSEEGEVEREGEGQDVCVGDASVGGEDSSFADSEQNNL